MNIMKSIFVLSCCLALTAGVVTAEPQKEGKGKRARAAGGGQQVQRVHQGQGPKRAGSNRQGGSNAGRSNATHGNRAGRRAFSTGEQGNGAAAQRTARAGRRAEVKHFDFANRTTPNVNSVTFRANRRIIGSENWRGSRYVVFRNYRPAWHDRVWWIGHYPRIVLIGGGWYYWNSGFWYPAWGYD